MKSLLSNKALMTCLVFALGLLFSFGALAEKAAVQGVTDDEIVIGTWGPHTGPASSWSAVNLATDAYFKWINELGGIHGRKLKLVIRDDGYMPPRTVAAVKELAERERVFCFVAGLGAAPGMAVKDYIDSKKMINIGFASGSHQLIEPVSHYRFGVYPSFRIDAKMLVKYAVKTLGHTKLAMFYQNDVFGKDGLKSATETSKELGAEIIASVPYELSDNDLSSQALKIKAADAQTVIVWATAKHAAIFAKEVAKLGYKPQLLASSSVSDPIMCKLAGEAWNDTIIANWMPMVSEETEGIKVYKEALAKYAPDLTYGNFSMAGFILAEPFIEGLRRAGRDLTTESLITALESIKHYNGLFVHDVTYAPDDHQGIESIYFVQAKDGKLVRISDWIE